MKENEANLPGLDAFDLLQREPFVCLSGLPGSGKTTLVKALLVELCGQQPSRLRTTLAGSHGIAPVPLMLRELTGLDTIQTFDELMEAWWRNLEQRASQGDALDIDRLKFCFSAKGDAFPLLLLFDGIDETGGVDIRGRLISCAHEAQGNYRHRILVTGRPNGFEGIEVHLLSTLDERKSPQKNQVDLIFTEKLPAKDGQGKVHLVFENPTLHKRLFHLLPLAWPQIQSFINKWYQLRPEWEIKRKAGVAHFLAALQDVNRSYLLPLARRPIFLTLMALVHCTRNEMPHGRAELYEAIVDLYLNRQERHRQLKYSILGKPLKAWPPMDKRRVLCHIAYQSQQRRAEQSIDRDKPEQGGILWPREELKQIIFNYLDHKHKSGFSIAPEDAEDLLDYFLHPAGLLVAPTEWEISFAHLSFQEYLCAEDIQRRLTGLNAEDVFYKELAANLDKPGWEEVGLLLLVIHKSRSEDGHLELLGLLNEQQENQACLWIQAVCGKELALSADQRRGLLSKLVECCLRHPDANLPRFWLEQDCAAELVEQGLCLLLDLLRNTYQNQVWGWLYGLKPDDRLHRLLALIVGSRWGCKNDFFNPISSQELELALADSLTEESLLWERRFDKEFPVGLPRPTETGLCLDALLPSEGALWWRALSLLPVDAWLLQGESYDEDWLVDIFSQPMVLMAIYPHLALPPRARLALGLYQALLLTELGGWNFHELWRCRSRSLLLSRSSARALLRTCSRSLSLSLWRSRLRSQSRSLSLSRSMSWPHSLSPRLANQFEVCSKIILNTPIYHYDPLPRALERFGHQYAAYNWFQEQAENPNLMRLRGLRPGEPLPKALGLFDDQGMPFAKQHKENWKQLSLWLGNDDKVLNFFFPEGLGHEDEAVLRKDLEILQQQPWSPQAFMKVTLDHWPEGEDLDFSYANAERRMVVACEAFLQAQTR